jgi:exodeoxyribonuclease VII small subunit
VAKKKTSTSGGPKESLSFEEALAKLEQVVGQLEDGRTGLDEALKSYEQGVKYLKHCHQMLQRAERKIAILRGVDDEGNVLSEPLDEETMSLEEKADNRSRRRRRPSSGRPSRQEVRDEDDDMDQTGRLF